MSTQLLRVGGIQYYVHKAAQPLVIPHFTAPEGRQGSLIPCTFMDWPEDQFEDKDLNIILNNFGRDDVWTPSFLEVIVLRTPKSIVLRTGKLEVISTLTETISIPSGPYAVQLERGKLFGVSRFFDDTCNAFIGGSVKSTGDLFEWLNIERSSIAVPSKLYFEATPARSLSGLRFAVKDIIDVNGLETGCGNHCYRDLYPKRIASAPCVQKLLDAGAVLVGKTKTTQFAEGQVPLQWLDYLAPSNPRGDSYQSPSSSSAGSAVASAAYSWLDFTIATDTGGSVRHPAGVCGIYGLRSSSKTVNTAGMYSVSSVLDSVGITARSASVAERVMQCIAEPLYLSFPLLTPHTSFKLLYPVRAETTKSGDSQRWFPFPNISSGMPDAEASFETTVQQLESYLGCRRTPINLDDMWCNTQPSSIEKSETLDNATKDIYTALSTYTSVREVIEPFIAKYRAVNNGRAPFIDPIVRARQAKGLQITASQYAAALKSAEKVSQWIIDILLAPSQENEFPLLIFPQSWGTPNYRDEPDPGPLFSSVFSIYSLSYLSGAPDCTVPIGEVSQYSRITDADMFLPISLSVLSRPGTDLTLVALLRKLENEGILRPVATGLTMYPKSL